MRGQDQFLHIGKSPLVEPVEDEVLVAEVEDDCFRLNDWSIFEGMDIFHLRQNAGLSVDMMGFGPNFSTINHDNSSHLDKFTFCSLSGANCIKKSFQ